MDKIILRNFAVESRNDLLEKIDRKIKLFYIDEEFKKENKGDIIVLSNDKHTITLTKEEDKNRDKLISRIATLGYNQVLEEASYTWFNRIIAIRYMEIHDYLPLSKDNQSLGIRVLSSLTGDGSPDILKFSNLNNNDLDIKLDREKYSQLQTEDEKFKYVLLMICNKLGKVIPQVFDGETDYIDLLIPDNMLNSNGFINKLISEIPENSFEQVEIIGWLYQYYISEKKDNVFKKLKENVKISKENIPAATQLFTPDWIVKYMIDNTIGKYGIKNGLSKEVLKYYKENKISVEDKSIEEVKFIDPCCGSGHIIVYAFDLFVKIYETLGYNKKDIAQLVLENNLYGLDVDDRAGQLSILALLLKAREYDKNIFKKDLKINVMSIKESNDIVDSNMLELSETNKKLLDKLIETFSEAKEYGSLFQLKQENFTSLLDELNSINNIFVNLCKPKIIELIKQWKILSTKYDVVVTNPPYMGNKGMSPKLANYAKKYFDDSKADMFAIFIEQARFMCKENGFYAMITQPSILFLKSFEILRKKIIEDQTIVSLLHMGRGIFGVDFGSTSFVIKNSTTHEYEGDYFRLHKRTFQYIDVEDIKNIYLNSLVNPNYEFNFDNYNNDSLIIDSEPNEEEQNLISDNMKIYYKTNQEAFLRIPGTPIAYWVEPQLLKIFNNEPIEKYVLFRQGMATSDNNRFLRYWYEINQDKMCYECNDLESALNSKKKWFMYNKGGAYRKWYGNHEYVVNWENDGKEMKEYTATLPQGMNVRLKSREYYFKKCYSWSKICASDVSFRYYPDGFAFDVAGCCVFEPKVNLYYLLGLSNSVITGSVLKLISPTLNFELDHLKKIPLIVDDTQIETIEKLVKSNINIAKEDWDDSELSWNFKKHPFLKYNIDNDLQLTFNNWLKVTSQRIEELKSNEELINKIFIKIYGLEGVVDYRVSEDKITLYRANQTEDVKSFVSYIVGCIFGRYSLKHEGLYCANLKNPDDGSNLIDNDNIVPISDNNYINYTDDMVAKFISIITNLFGKDKLEKNLDFISQSIGKKGTESSEDTIRRYFVNDFYDEHVKKYQKRPIYWMFDSGKKNGFKCLIYLHRYNEQIVSKIRVDYLHKTIDAYKRTLNEIEYTLNNNSNAKDIKELQNKRSELSAKITECNEYEERVGNVANKKVELDLDDGIVTNYNKITDDNGKSILAKLK